MKVNEGEEEEAGEILTEMVTEISEAKLGGGKQPAGLSDSEDWARLMKTLSSWNQLRRRNGS